MNTRISLAHFRGGVARGVLAAACAAAACLAAAGEAAETSSATASAPTSLPAAAAATDPIDRALDFDKDELTILDDIQDDDQIDGTALCVMLQRVEMLPDGPEVLDRADWVSPANLWSHPGRYRSRLIALECEYSGAPPDDYTRIAVRTFRWPYPKPVMLVHVLIKDATGDYSPAIVIMGRKPPAHLRRGSRLKVAGLFYKLAELDRDTDDPALAGKSKYPILVAKKLYEVEAPGAGVPPGVYVMILAVAALLAAYIWLKRRIRPSATAGRAYKSLRHEADDEEGQNVDDDEEGEEVDEDLRREVQEYLDEKREAEDDDIADDNR